MLCSFIPPPIKHLQSVMIHAHIYPITAICYLKKTKKKQTLVGSFMKENRWTCCSWKCSGHPCPLLVRIVAGENIRWSLSNLRDIVGGAIRYCAQILRFISIPKLGLIHIPKQESPHILTLGLSHIPKLRLMQWTYHAKFIWQTKSSTKMKCTVHCIIYNDTAYFPLKSPLIAHSSV